MSSGRYSYSFPWHWGSLSPPCALLKTTVSTIGSWCVHRLGAYAHALSATQVISSAWWYAGWEPGHQESAWPLLQLLEQQQMQYKGACHVSENFSRTYNALTELPAKYVRHEMPHKANGHVSVVLWWNWSLRHYKSKITWNILCGPNQRCTPKVPLIFFQMRNGFSCTKI